MKRTTLAQAFGCLLLFSGWINWDSKAGSITRICDVQGSGFVSPLNGSSVTVRGIVTQDLDTRRAGFFLQETNCDSDPATSDGVFVYLGTKQEVVSSGDWVEVTGTVQEYYNRTEILSAPVSVSWLGGNQNLPTPVELNPPSNNQQADYYFEALEGMRVNLADARVVGPTNSSEETFVVRNDLERGRVFWNDPGGTGEVICVDDGGLFKIQPQVKVGDQVLGLEGTLDYSYEMYRIWLETAPQITPAGLPAGRFPNQIGTESQTLRVATFNLANLFDTVDDPLKDDTILSNTEYQRRLKKRALAIRDSLQLPYLLAVQEVENQAVLSDLNQQAEIAGTYSSIWLDGPDLRGQDVALLYKPDRLDVLNYQPYQGCINLVDGLGPDGNQNVLNPQNSLTCDSDGDGFLDGNRLFSRPLLAAQFRFCPSGCSDGSSGPVFSVLANHWKSKVEDSFSQAFTLPRRTQEAQFTAALVSQLRLASPTGLILVLGDLNDHPDSQPLQALQDNGMLNLDLTIDPADRYSYIYQGISQTLDYVWYSVAGGLIPEAITAVHINADYPASNEKDAASPIRSSDHDPLVASFLYLQYQTGLPLVIR